MPHRRRPPIGTILFLLFTVFTLAEIFLIIQLAKWTNWPFTIFVTIVSAVLGSAMAKRAGVAVLARAQAELARGKFPARPLADGVMILLGGAFLITPGLITDLIGFSTLIPVCRQFYANILMGWGKKAFAGRATVAGPGVFFKTWQAGGGGGPKVHDAEPGSYHSEPREATGPRVRSAPVPPRQDAVDVEFRRVD
ncbi:MAG: protein FxsA [Candidatus Sumerlaeota bacterium]|nr:protein FxsA [Candidatus Sumerlaeota bacterium]